MKSHLNTLKLVGNVIYVSDEHLVKANFPILLTLFQKVKNILKMHIF